MAVEIAHNARYVHNRISAKNIYVDKKDDIRKITLANFSYATSYMDMNGHHHEEWSEKIICDLESDKVSRELQRRTSRKDDLLKIVDVFELMISDLRITNRTLFKAHEELKTTINNLKFSQRPNYKRIVNNLKLA